MRQVAKGCQRQGLMFLLLAIDSHKGWHKVAVGELRKLGGVLARYTGQLEGEAISHLFQRLSTLSYKQPLSLERGCKLVEQIALKSMLKHFWTVLDLNVLHLIYSSPSATVRNSNLQLKIICKIIPCQKNRKGYLLVSVQIVGPVLVRDR